jgi:DNA-binding SARP family transcriptional activator
MDTDTETTPAARRGGRSAPPQDQAAGGRRPGDGRQGAGRAAGGGSGSHFKRASASNIGRPSAAGDRLRALASLLAILGLLVGVPLALAIFVGWPLPTEIPSGDRIGEAFRRQDVPVEVIVNGLAIVVWLAWAQLAWALGIETVAIVKGRAARRAPLLPGTQLMARQLVASAALILGTLTAVKPVSAAPLNALQEAPPADDGALRTAGLLPDTGTGTAAGTTAGEAADTAATSAAAASTGAVAPASAPIPEQLYEVRRGDTFWGLADQHLGSGMRWREIRDRNVGRAVAPGRVLGSGDDHLDVGWRLVLPPTTRSSGTLPTQPMPVAEDAPLTAPPDAAPPGTRLAELDDEGSGIDAAAAHQDAAVPQAEAGPTTPSPAAPPLAGADPVVAPPAAAESPASDPVAAPAQQQQQQPPAPMPAAGEVVVQPGDHFWGLAERQLEEAWGRPVTAEEIAPYWRSLVAANQAQVSSGDPNLIFPGEHFETPAPPATPTATAPSPAPPAADPAPAPAPPAPAPEPEPAPEPTTTTTAPTTTSTTATPSTTSTTTDAGADESAGGDRSADEAPPEATTPPSDDEQAAPPPSTAPPTTSAPTTTVPPTTTAPPTTAAPPPTTAPPTTVPPTTTAPPTTASPTTASPAPPTTAAPPTPTTTGGGAADDTSAPRDDGQGEAAGQQTRDDDGDGTFPVAPVGATAALAGLVLLVLARRRRARSRSIRPGDIVEPRLADDISLERGLGIAAADVLDQVHGASRALGVVLSRHPELPAILAVTVAPSRKVTVYFAEPVEPVAPFEAGPPSEAWTLYLDEMEFWSGEEATTAVLNTVTAVGQTDMGEWVFVDLESLGALELDGDPLVAAELAQSMVAELSLQPVSEPMLDLTVIGMDELSPSVVEQGVVRMDRLDEDLVRQVEQSAERTSSLLDQEHVRSSAAARARGVAGDGLFVMIVAYGGADPGDPVLMERLATAAAPGGRGVAVVATGSLGAGATRLLVTDDGRGHIPRLGLTFTAARLERHDLDRIAELLAREPEMSTRGPARTRPRPAAPAAPMAASLRGDDDADPSVAESGFGPADRGDDETEVVVGAEVDLDRDLDLDYDLDYDRDFEREPVGEPEPPQYVEPAWRYCVRIFADHLVEQDSGDVVSFRYGENPDVPNKNTHRGPELLAYLALSGRAASATDVRDHLWWDRPVAIGTVNKLLYGTRKVLGGADLLSLATEDPVGRYRLAPEVVTDVELLSHALEHAHAMAVLDPEGAVQLLRQHLSRVEAVAFRSNTLGQGLAEWAAAYRVIDRVEQPVIDAGLLVAKLCTEAGGDRYPEALWAVDQALLACPINEALVRAAMEIEARLGSTDAVNHRYLNLATKLARDELEPEPETSDLRARLGARGRRHPRGDEGPGGSGDPGRFGDTG